MAAGLWYENDNQICGRVAQLDRALASEANFLVIFSRNRHPELWFWGVHDYAIP